MNISTNPMAGRVGASRSTGSRCGRILRGIIFLCASAVIAGVTAHAATIVGRVSTESSYLGQATVRVVGTNIRVLTEKDGSYRISGLQAGSHTLEATYSGMDVSTQTVTASEGQPTVADFLLTSEVYDLETITVSTYLEGVDFAKNQQRTANSVRSVTSVDTFIDTVTGNPGEFLKNLGGVQMDYSQNEPNRIRIRGIDPNLTTITMDGNEIAGAASSGTGRALQIDQLTISSIGNVEVYKAPIPSMSANAIGGSVNFQTKSAFDVKGRRASITLGVNTESHDFLGKGAGPGHGDYEERRAYPIGRLEYMNSFMDNRLGVYFTAGRDHTNQLGSSVTADFNSPSAVLGGRDGSTVAGPPEQLTYQDVELRRRRVALAPNRQLRTRSDASLNLDYKAGENLTLFLKATHSDYHSTNRNHGLGLNQGSYTGDWDAYTVSGGNATQGVSVFEKKTTSSQYNTGFRFIDEDWKIDFNIANSTSRNTYKNPWHFSSLNIRVDDIAYNVTHIADSEVPAEIQQVSGPDFYKLNNYRPNQGDLYATGGEHRRNHNAMVHRRNRDTTEDRLSSRLDVRRYFHGENRFYLQAGISFNETERDIHRGELYYYWMGEDGIATPDDITTAANLGRFAEPDSVGLQLTDAAHVREPQYFNTNALFNYWQENPQVLQLNTARVFYEEHRRRMNIQEAVTGLYAMGNFTMEKFNVMAGVRSEETTIDAWGPRVLPTYDSTKGETAQGPDDVDLKGNHPDSLIGLQLSRTTLATKSSYTSDPFPYLHLKYDWTPQFLTRFSYTESIGRPDFGDIIPNVSEDPDPINPTIEISRGGLGPQRSDNLDFSAEYYGENGTEITFGWFNRDIKDFIQSSNELATPALLQEFGLGSDYSNYIIRTKSNVGSAKWSGWETSFRFPLSQFDSMPQIVQNFEFFGNYTDIYKMDKDLNDGAPKNRINNVIPHQYTAGVTYRSPDGKLLLRLSQNYQGVRISDDYPVTSASQQDNSRQEEYEFLNFESSYQASERVRLMFIARNLGGERQVISQYGLVTNKRQDTGVAYTLSVKYDL